MCFSSKCGLTRLIGCVCVSSQVPPGGGRAGAAPGGGGVPRSVVGGNVRGEIADDIILQELAALQKQSKNWHVMGLDKKLDAAVLSADEHTAIGQLKMDFDDDVGPAGVADAGAGAQNEEEEELRRMREEIEVLDRMAAIMREKPPNTERPTSPSRRLEPHPSQGPQALAVPSHAAEQRHVGVYMSDQYARRDGGGPPGGFQDAMGIPPVAWGGAVADPSRSPAPVPLPPVPGGFLGSPGGGDHWRVEKEQLRAEQQAKQLRYKEQLDESVRLKNAQHGRRSIGVEPTTGTSLQFGEERADDKEERQRRYRRELDEQVREKVSPTKSQASARGSHLSSAIHTPAHRSNGAHGAARDANGSVHVAPAVTSPGLTEAATKVASMHWGERDVQRWYDEEAKKKDYKEQLLEQIREKQELQRRQAAEASSAKKLIHHLDAPPHGSAERQGPEGARAGGATIRDLAPQFAREQGESEATRPPPAAAHAGRYLDGDHPPPPQQHFMSEAPAGTGVPAYYMPQSPAQYSSLPPPTGGFAPAGSMQQFWGEDSSYGGRVMPGTGRPMWVERSNGGLGANGVNGSLFSSPSTRGGGAPAGLAYQQVAGIVSGGAASPTGSYVPKEQFDAVLAKMQMLEAQIGQMHQNQTPGGRGASGGRRRDGAAGAASTGTASYAGSSSSRVQARVPKAGRRAGR